MKNSEDEDEIKEWGKRKTEINRLLWEIKCGDQPLLKGGKKWGEFYRKQKYFEKWHFKIRDPVGIIRLHETKICLLDQAELNKLHQNLNNNKK